MIPAIPHIEKSLAALRLVEEQSPDTSERCVTICPRIGRSRPDGTRFQDCSALVLRQDDSAPMSILSLVKRLREELHKTGHVHVGPKTEFGEAITAKVLAMSTGFTSAPGNVLKILNATLAAVSLGRVAQWAVFPGRAATGGRYEFGDFVYGEIELSTLRYRCERAGSNYCDLYGNQLRGRLAIHRESPEIKSVDVNSIVLPEEPTSTRHLTTYRIIEDYYGDLANAEQRQFMQELDRSQAIFGAVGLGTIPSEMVRRLSMSSLVQWITVFYRQQRQHGWVVLV